MDTKKCDTAAALEAADLDDKFAAAYLLQSHHEPRWVLRRRVEDQAAIDRAAVELLRREEPK